MDPRTRTVLARIAARVRALRRERDLTARALAERADLSVRFVAQLEAGEANIAIGRLAAVADALAVPLDELVREERAARVIALLGLRGAGKSTVGPRLARALSVPFVELDAAIEKKAGLDLGTIFTLHGEGYYRRLEVECLAERIDAGAPCVMALSGGIVHNAEAFELVRRHCRTVWLKADPEHHMQRVLDVGDRRPVEGRANAMAELRTLLATREPLYRQADVAIDTSRRTVAQVVDDLAHTLTPALPGAGPAASARSAPARPRGRSRPGRRRPAAARSARRGTPTPPAGGGADGSTGRDS